MRERSLHRQMPPNTLFWPWPVFPLGAVALLLGSFFYVWLRVDPALEYYSVGPYFYQQRAFLEAFLTRPGGLASYVGVYLAQLNQMSLAGALVFVLTECGVLVASHVCLARISGRAPGLTSFIPVLVLLGLRNRYGSPWPAMSIGLLLALAAFFVLACFCWRRPWWFTVVSGLVSSLLFVLTGSWSAALFALLCGLLVVLQLRVWYAGLVCLGVALAASLAAVAVLNFPYVSLLNPWGTGVNWPLAATLYGSVPVAAVLLAFMHEPQNTPAPRQDHRRNATWLGQGVVVVVFLVGGCGVWLAFEPRQKLLAEIDHAASTGRHEAVLAAARQLKALTDPAKTRLELALFHQGRLAEDLFAFHDLTEGAPSGAGEECRAQSQVLFELGLISDSEHMACEALVMEGDRPDLLRLLARINLLKNRPEAAQIFLNVLSLVPFQAEQPNEAWPIVEPKRLVPERECALLEGMRTTMLTNDVLHDGLPLGRLLDVSLALNPTNRMAFEYAMATYLLDLDLKQAIERLRLLDNFNYVGIPRTYEEALLLFQELERVRVDLKGRTIRPKTVQRFHEFKEAVREWKEKAEGRALMAAHFGDTYWYYYASRSREPSTAGPASAP